MSSTTFDDRSPFIVYSPQSAWRLKIGKPQEFNATTSGCNTPGATATLTFNGTSIEVFGTLESTDQDQKEHIPEASSLYSIDNGPQTTFEPVEFQNTTQYNVKFFQASDLSLNMSHTLVVTINSKGSFFLDYIQVDSVASLAVGVSPTGDTLSPSPSTSDGFPSSSISPSSSHHSNNSEGHSQSDSHENSTDGIIAVVLGIVSFVILLCALFFFLGKRKRANKLRQREREREEKMMMSIHSSGGDDSHFGGYVNPKTLEEGYPAGQKRPSWDSSWMRTFWQRPKTEVVADTRSVASGPVFYAQ